MRHVHFMGICGYATSGAALLAQQNGDRVTGSDDFAYPPTTDILTAAGIDWVNQSDPANLERWGRPDLVVVGNQTRPQNPELVAAQTLGLQLSSEIEFYRGLSGARMRIAVCGTHGKSTTSALLVHMLMTAGLDPGYRLGATSLDYDGTAQLGSGPFVFEGDEYSTSPWDKRPKFLHLDPAAACVTRLELDHPDLYPTLEAYVSPFQQLVAQLPADGLLVLCADDPLAMELAPLAPCAVQTYGLGPDAGTRIEDISYHDSGMHFRVTAPVNRDVTLSFPGQHNALNAAAALLLAHHAGADLQSAVAACATFKGPGRRFQVLGEFAGVLVVDDYAHHPTEVAVTIKAARDRYPQRRIIAVHTPHTYSRTRTLLSQYADAFCDADVVVMGPIDAARERDQAPTISNEEVTAVLSGSQVKHTVGSCEEALACLGGMARPGDLILVLSLGGFDKLAARLPHLLESAVAR